MSKKISRCFNLVSSVYEMMWKDIFSSIIIGTVIELLVESIMVPIVTIPLFRHISRIKEEEEK